MIYKTPSAPGGLSDGPYDLSPAREELGEFVEAQCTLRGSGQWAESQAGLAYMSPEAIGMFLTPKRRLCWH